MSEKFGGAESPFSRRGRRNRERTKQVGKVAAPISVTFTMSEVATSRLPHRGSDYDYDRVGDYIVEGEGPNRRLVPVNQKEHAEE